MADGPITEGMEGAWVETGTIYAVNPKTMTVSWAGELSDREIDDLQLSSGTPLHQAFGEGGSGLPDVGAKCAVCFPSDDDPPFILCFLADPEEHTNEDGSVDASFKSGRQKMVPGDWRQTGRKGNQIWLHRGGMIQIGSSPGNQTFWIPAGNLLWNVCKRYRHDAAGGRLLWEVKEVGGVGDATEFRALLREAASDRFATVGVRIGKLIDVVPPPATPVSQAVFEFVVAPQQITDEGKSAAQKIVIRYDKEGNAYKFAKGSVITVVGNEVFETIKTRRTVVQTDDTLTISGNRTETITGNRETTAANQNIHATVGMLLDSPFIRYGSLAASQPALLGALAVGSLIPHTHPGPFMPSPELASLASALSRKHLLDS